jgi:hypothetical protein
MPTRYQALLETLAGYKKTGMSLIAYDGHSLHPPAFGDDVGIYYFVPKIAQVFNMPIDRSFDIFIIGLTLISVVLALVGLFLLFKRPASIIVSLLGVSVLAFTMLKLSDVYVAAPFAILSVVPICLYFIQQNKLCWSLLVTLFFAGSIIGIANAMRSNAGTTVMIFLLILLAFYMRVPRRVKLILLSMLIIGTLIPSAFFSLLLNHRDDYLRTVATNNCAPRQHVIWHSIYIGLGFLNNEYDIRYKDEVAFAKVKSISASVAYLSPEYEAILRKEVVSLAMNHPTFIIKTVLAKLGVMQGYLLIFANLGLLAAAIYRKRCSLELAFWVGLAFSSISGLLVVPIPGYVSGFIALAMLYSIMSINYAMENGLYHDIMRLLANLRNMAKLAT